MELGRITIAVVLVLRVGAGLAAEPIEPPGRLGYVALDSVHPRSNLAECDRLTIEKYRSHGITVEVVAQSRYQAWFEKEGSAFSKATEGIKALAFSRAHDLDSIGGLRLYDIHENEAKLFNVAAGPQMVSWGLSRAGCTINQTVDPRPLSTRSAIPLHLGGPTEGPWSVPLLPPSARAETLAPSGTAATGWVGKSLPELRFRDAQQGETELSAFRGKVVVLEFWATFCIGCIEELPVYQMLSDRNGNDGLVWIGVSSDHDSKAWERFVSDNALGGRQVRAPEWSEILGIRSFPTTLILNRELTVVAAPRHGQIVPAALAALKSGT